MINFTAHYAQALQQAQARTMAHKRPSKPAPAVQHLIETVAVSAPKHQPRDITAIIDDMGEWGSDVHTCGMDDLHIDTLQ